MREGEQEAEQKRGRKRQFSSTRPTFLCMPRVKSVDTGALDSPSPESIDPFGRSAAPTPGHLEGLENLTEKFSQDQQAGFEL